MARLSLQPMMLMLLKMIAFDQQSCLGCLTLLGVRRSPSYQSFGVVVDGSIVVDS